MWFLGHTALGFAFAAVVFGLSRSRRFEVRVLVLVPFLANLIDFFHPDEIRLYAHNWVAAILLPVAAIVIWQRWMRWSRTEAIALFAASLGAPVGDQIFGSFYPYGPLNWIDVEWMEFNSVADLATEAMLGLALIVVLVLLYRGLSGPRALVGFRGPWILSPLIAVLATSALFWGEVVVFIAADLWTSVGPLAYAVLAELIVSAAIVTAWWVAALDLARRERRAAARS